MESNQTGEDTLQGKYLLFAIGDEVYGIEIRYVTEIIGMQHLNALPEAPEYLMGIINLRGKIIPVVDMRIRFKKQASEYTDRSCIVVIESELLLAGLIVDEVADVLAFGDNDIAPRPRFELGAAKRYIKGIGKVKNEVKLLLDCDKLFSEEEMQFIDDVSKESAGA